MCLIVHVLPSKYSFRSVNGGSRDGNGVSDPETGVSGINNPQSRVKERKVNKTKVGESRFISSLSSLSSVRHINRRVLKY